MKTLILILLLILPSLLTAEEPLFPLMGPIHGGDWLAVFNEPGQSYQQFLKSDHNVPNKQRNIIHILPVEPLDTSLERLLIEATEAYYGITTNISTIKLDTTVYPSRINHGRKQFQIYPILDTILNNLPNNSFCTIAVTKTDLYPDEKWNFVFGMADLKERVGIFSFNRYAIEDTVLFRKRCVKVLTHEIGHMFGLHHCIKYQCNMNGSNSLAETDSHPLYLCPECLKKICHSVPTNKKQRYQKLLTLFEKEGFTNEAAWIKRRLKNLK